MVLRNTSPLFRKKLQPGVLQRFREGLPRPSVIDDIAGVRLGNIQSVSVSPRYVDDHSGLGPLVFHHLNYCGGARGPHRPIVMRGVLRPQTYAGWKSQVERTVDAHHNEAASKWIPLPVGLEAGVPKLTFAVGSHVGTELLLVPDCTSPPSSSSPAVTSSAAAARLNAKSHLDTVSEPWRLGIGLDAHIQTTQRSIVQRVPGLGTQTIGPDVDCFFLPWESIVLDVSVPAETMHMCERANRERAQKRYTAGLCSKLEVDQPSPQQFGLSSSESTIRATVGDVVFLPSQFSYSVSRPVGYQVTSDSAAHSTVRPSKVTPTPMPRAPVLCVSLRFAKLPRLSDAQARLYMPADYTATRLHEFYTKGGNPLVPQYK